MEALEERRIGVGGVLEELELNALSRKPIVIQDVVSSYDRRPDAWRDVSEKEWASWEWQWSHRLLNADDVDRVIGLLPHERRAIEDVADQFSVAVSPHYAALIHSELKAECPIRKQAIPTASELECHEDLMSDPLGEYRHAISFCATRRYPDRALIYTTHECAMRCRHCTRRGRVGLMERISHEDLSKAVECVLAEERVRDVLISGGDPLSLSNEELEFLFASLRKSDHIDVIRLCTRMPCTLPQRFNDPDLLDILNKYSPIYVNTQFNHPYEASCEAAHALKALRQIGCILGNQSVLLRGINDRGEVLEPLYRWLLREGCRPYYLFLCDAAQGTSHFRTSIQAGLEVMDTLRGRLSGLGIPHYVIDLPGGYGKVDLCPQHIEGGEPNARMRIRNWFGAVVDYKDV